MRVVSRSFATIRKSLVHRTVHSEFERPGHVLIPLTDTAVRQAKPADKEFTLTDAHGLSLFVAVNGTKSWHFRFSWHGKQPRISLGKYPDVSLIREANGAVGMFLGSTQIVGAVAYWDCSLGKIRSDASALSLLLTDARGQLYWHLAEGLTGELAEFDDKDRIIGGQVWQVRAFVIKYQIPCVVVETNGPGGFVPNILKQALKGTGCGVREEHSSTNKQKRILDAFEPPLSSRFLWAHVNVLKGPVWDQMRDFNPGLTTQDDDYIDSGAGAISQTPVRIGRIVGKPTETKRDDWRPDAGTHEVQVDY